MENKTKKILFVYPEVPKTFWSFYYVLGLVGRKSSFSALGALTVARMLPEEWETKLINMNITSLTDEDILWADYVFISAMVAQQESAGEIISRCKRLGVKTVGGGPLFDSFPENYPNLDCIVQGETENIMSKLIEDIESGTLARFYESKERPDITSSPIPLWSLINMQDYVTMAVQFSRGCPHDCEFCDITARYGRNPRMKSVSQVEREFDALFEAGWRSGVFIVDDNFIGNKKKVKGEFLPAIIKWQKEHGYPFKLLTQLDITLANDEELMAMMREANFEKVFIGIETSNLESLKEAGKKQNLKHDIVGSVKIIQGYGMVVMGGFIIGFDNDIEQTGDDLFDLIQESGIVTAMVGMLMALPGSKLEKRLKKEGRLLGMASGDNTGASLSFRPVMGEKNLLRVYRDILRRLYLNPKNYFSRVRKLSQNLKPQIKGLSIARWDFTVLYKFLWQVGIKSKNRWYCWRELLWALIFNTKALPMVAEQCVLELHFRKVSENVVSELDRQLAGF